MRRVEASDPSVTMEIETSTVRGDGDTYTARVIAIVVTYNGRKWIDKCLPSLLQNQHVESVIMVDNGSTDGTCEAARRHGSRVKVLESGCNLGFGKANNVGIEQALAAGVTHVFLLNQDAWIEPNGIDRMLACFSSSAGWGILCPLQLTGDGRTLDRFTFGCLPERLVSDLCLGRPVAAVYPVSFMNAAAWLVSRATIEAIGVFDPVFPIYGEDDDYVRRLRRESIAMGLCPGVKVFHDRAERKPSRSESRNRALALAIMNLKYAEHPLAVSTPLMLMRAIRRALGKALTSHWSEVSLQYAVTARVLGMLGQIRQSRIDFLSRHGNGGKGRLARTDSHSEAVVPQVNRQV